MKNKKNLDYITKIAIFSALSCILYFFPKFPLPFFPPFLDIQFSNLPGIIGGFAMGPIGGILIILIKTLIKLPFSSTAYVGELADLLIGIATVLTSSLIYRHAKTKKGGLIALISGAIVWVLVALLVNWQISLPFYIEFFCNGNIDKFIQMCNLNQMNSSNYIEIFLFVAILPFNLLLASIVSTITFFVYKRISILIKKEIIK